MTNTGPGPRFPDVIRTIVLDYAAEFCLLDWIESQRLSSRELAKNPRAVDYLLKNSYDIRWPYCSGNPSMFYTMRDTCPGLFVWAWMADNTNPAAIEYMIANIDLVKAEVDSYEHLLSRNPHAVPWLREHPEYINYAQLSMNPAAIDLLMANPDKIDFMYLCANPHPWAIAHIDANPDKICAYLLCTNENGLGLIKKYTDHPRLDKRNAHWAELCERTNPETVAYMLEHPDKIN